MVRMDAAEEMSFVDPELTCYGNECYDIYNAGVNRTPAVCRAKTVSLTYCRAKTHTTPQLRAF